SDSVAIAEAAYGPQVQAAAQRASRALGGDIVSGLIDSLLEGAPRIASTVQRLVNNSVIYPAKKALRIESPSRVFHDFGYQTMAGFDQGASQGSQSTEKKMKDIWDNIGKVVKDKVKKVAKGAADSIKEAFEGVTDGV